MALTYRNISCLLKQSVKSLGTLPVSTSSSQSAKDNWRERNQAFAHPAVSFFRAYKGMVVPCKPCRSSQHDERKLRFCNKCDAVQTGRSIRGLPMNPNQDRSLRDLPDYSFVDGSPTPYGSKQRLRIEAQRSYTAKIIALTEEVDLAERLYKEREAAKKAFGEERIARKLKKKGDKLLDS